MSPTDAPAVEIVDLKELRKKGQKHLTEALELTPSWIFCGIVAVILVMTCLATTTPNVVLLGFTVVSTCGGLLYGFLVMHHLFQARLINRKIKIFEEL